jgi:translation initiation factor IF-2
LAIEEVPFLMYNSPLLMTPNDNKRIERPPVVAVMGHIDHGKSTLLDYIRKSNVTLKEAGGITQHISAYEVTHKTASGEEKKITFLDTPGHEAFKTMRRRGATAADIAILVVAADDGVKAQTLEALESIKQTGTPFVVAINKIDKPGANIDRTKQNLAENDIFVEGYGGHVSFVAVSAKTGEGIDELLEIILLSAEVENFTYDDEENASGTIIESNLDPKKGVAASLIIKEGKLKSGMFVVSEDCFAPVRIMENYLAKQIKVATAGSPVRIIGFNKLPSSGASFITVASKKEAEKEIEQYKSAQVRAETIVSNKSVVIPIIIKSDVSGLLDAIEHELEKVVNEKVGLKILLKGTGDISENDIKIAGSDLSAIVVGFNVKIEAEAKDLAERFKIKINTFKIIYELATWVKEIIEERTPSERVEETIGRSKILRTFSRTKDRQVVGCKLQSGELKLHDVVKIIRRDAEIGKGKIVELQVNKIAAQKVTGEDAEFGSKIETHIDLVPGDYIESFSVSMKK